MESKSDPEDKPLKANPDPDPKPKQNPKPKSKSKFQDQRSLSKSNRECLGNTFHKIMEISLLAIAKQKDGEIRQKQHEGQLSIENSGELKKTCEKYMNKLRFLMTGFEHEKAIPTTNVLATADLITQRDWINEFFKFQKLLMKFENFIDLEIQKKVSKSS
jgi:hypothetical protein